MWLIPFFYCYYFYFIIFLYLPKICFESGERKGNKLTTARFSLSRLGVAWTTEEISFDSGKEKFFFSVYKRIQTGFAAHPPSCSMFTWGSSPEIKQLESEDAHSLLSNAKVKYRWSYPPLLYKIYICAFMACTRTLCLHCHLPSPVSAAFRPMCPSVRNG